ncbi:family 20 glycosylhydrolase [Algibacter lectus]|nr:family 20 glycosylhydrolase [Algibacter lectus]
MKNKLYRPFLATAICLLTLTACQEKTPKVYTEADINIIPKIEKVQINPGVFEFNENTTFVVSNDEQKNAATLLQDKFKLAANWDLAITDASEKSNIISFKEDKNLAEETYKLTVTDAQITIEASGNSGYLYAVQSLRQLLPTAIESKNVVSDISWEIPNIEIEDSPRFQYRGLMLDLSRHFFDAAYIKETIDAISMLKMNVLHLHLVDDQGWRIEIKKYPKLTEVGAWRVDQEDIPWNSRTKNSLMIKQLTVVF